MTADTYSNILGFLAMVTGNDNNNWGNNCNTAIFQIFEDAIANALTSTVTGGTLDLSGSPPPNAASQVRYAALIFNGTLGSNQIVKVPNLSKFWWVQNATAGAYTLTIETPTITTSAVIPQNSGWQLVLCDGNQNIVCLPFNSKQILMPDGSAAAPAYSDVNEPASGWYRNGTQDWRLSINDADVLQVTGAGAGTPSVVNVLAPNSLQQAGVQVIPPGTEMPFAGVTVPTGFLLEYGQTVSRTTYVNLLAALRGTFTGTFTNGSPTITGVSVNFVGLGIEGAVIESATSGITSLTVSSVTSNTITMSGNATASSGGAVTCYAYPWGNGDGSTTFGIPDRRGRVVAGRDNMGGTAASRLTSAGSGIIGTELTASGGAENETIGQTNLPSVNFAISGTAAGQATTTKVNTIKANGGIALSYGGGAVTVAVPSADASTTDSTIVANASSALTGTAASGGSGTPLTTVQPTGVANMIIKF